MLRTAFLITGGVAVIASAFDHQFPNYRSVLSTYVVNGGVRYDALASAPALLSGAKGEFEAVSRSQFTAFSEEEQIAFLVNAYNLYTIDLVVRNLPLKSGIRDISAPWDRKFIPILGQKVSLNYIEHELLRKEYREPRIHFALVCASRGCPELLDRPFTADKLDHLLEYAAKKFLTDTTRNRIDGKTLLLSQIFEWYGADFKATFKGGYREYVGKVLGLGIDDYKVRFLKYDWSLNEAMAVRE